MPWLRIPFSQEERRRKLARALDVQAIPTLVILDPRDNIITLDGRAELIEDPEGLVNENSKIRRFLWHGLYIFFDLAEFPVDQPFGEYFNREVRYFVTRCAGNYSFCR